MAWRPFNWGSRGPHYDTGIGVYVATILVDHGIQVTLFGHDTRNGELLHVFHVFASAAHPTATDCDTVCNVVDAWTDSGAHPLIGIIPPSTFVDRVVATSIAEVNGPQHEKAIGNVGTMGGHTLPSQNTLALKKGTARRGRRRRGRFFAWPPTVDALDHDDGNLFDASYVTEAVAVYTQLLNSLTTASYPLSVFSQADGALYTVTDIVAVDHLVDSQNRRGGGRGR